jgi:hypothetical protein
MVHGGTVMGRPKKSDKRTAKPRTVGVRATATWADWLERMAKAHRTTSAGMIDRALAEFAEHHDFETPPDRVD